MDWDFKGQQIGFSRTTEKKHSQMNPVLAPNAGEGDGSRELGGEKGPRRRAGRSQSKGYEIGDSTGLQAD